jgi:hypothetical protein
MTKSKFPFEHVIKYDTQEIWVTDIGSITAMGLPHLVEKYYPGYRGKIASRENFEKLKNQLVN